MPSESWRWQWPVYPVSSEEKLKKKTCLAVKTLHHSQT
jgi:hypothetical protein